MPLRPIISLCLSGLRQSAATLAALALVSGGATALAAAQHAHAAQGRGSAALIVSLAQRELARGVHEIPDGSNRSPDIRRYDRATVGSMYGAPWCAYFASYIAKQAGVPIGYGGAGIGYVPYIREWARATGRVRRTPKPGYLITFPEHVGIVEHVYANHTLSSIEGNAGNAVRREYHSWGEAVDYVQIAGDNGGPIEPSGAAKPRATAGGGRLVARIGMYPGTNVAVGTQVGFSSEDSSGNPVRQTWSFGDHSSARGSGPTHTYSTPGRYTVRLRLVDKRGRHSQATRVIDVHAAEPPQPVLSLDHATIHPGGTVNMDASRSTDPNGDVIQYEWDFVGNGNFEQGDDHASHTYTTPGTYAARVRVTDDRGLQSVATQLITVVPYDPPVAAINCDQSEIATGETLYCSSDDSSSPYSITAWDWSASGDGNYALHGQSISLSYPHPGTYTLALRVTDVHGNTSVADYQVTVDDGGPTAAITPPASIKINTPISFDGSGSADPDGKGLTYEWDAGQGAGWQAGGPTLTATYSQPGWYDVSLRVSDGAGQQDWTDYWIYVRNHSPLAAVSATPTSAVAGTAVSFDGSASSDPDPGDSIVKYQWDYLGNGSWVTGTATTSYTYASAGTYYARLRVTDRYGRTATATVKIVVS